VLRFSRSYVKVLPGFYKSRVCGVDWQMKSEEEIKSMLAKSSESDPETTPYLDGVKDALRWVLK
jgi:hypothetical protein